MPVILVVDDSKVDRFLISELLKAESLDWLVQFAESAEEAVAKLSDDTSLAVDLVVTDMLMPGMNGLQLVELVQKCSNPPPIILISGQGSETLAVEAIEKGAVSYVPKDQLAERLAATMKQVLMAHRSERPLASLLDTIEDVTYRFRLPNDPLLIPSVVSLLQQMAESMQLLDTETKTGFGIAVDEALQNAIYHGNLELDDTQLSECRVQLRNGDCPDSIRERAQVAPYNTRFVRVEAVLSLEKVSVTIRDDGKGFESSSATNARGRGLTLIKSHVDEMTFNDEGNEIRLVKLRGRRPHQSTRAATRELE